MPLQNKRSSWNKGLKMLPRVREALLKSNIGNIPWNKGLSGVFKHSEETKSNLSKLNKNRTMTDNQRKKLSQSLREGYKLGKIKNPKGMLGKKHSEETKEKMMNSHLGKKYKTMSLVGRNNISKSLEGRKLGSQAYENLSKYWKTGKENRFWKGGITPIKKSIRHLPKYLEWRSKVFERDDYTCQECGKNGCYLEAHHIKRFSRIIEEYNIRSAVEAEKCSELWDTNNGQTLCSYCHSKTKGYKQYESF
jgi:hypothetical protein